jgi:hypothetical protein
MWVLLAGAQIGSATADQVDLHDLGCVAEECRPSGTGQGDDVHLGGESAN